MAFDDLYSHETWGGPARFEPGERLTVSAHSPTEGGTPRSIELLVNGFVVSTERFPGTVSYTFTLAGEYRPQWGLDDRSRSVKATWKVSCSRLQPG